MFEEYDGKYLPLHMKVATGEHPVFGDFRVVRSIGDHTTIIEIDQARYALTMHSVMCALFAYLSTLPKYRPTPEPTKDAAGTVIARGDIVAHEPSGEKWIVVRAEYGYVYPAGWPPTEARGETCTVTDAGGGLEFLERAERDASAPNTEPERRSV